MPAQLIRTMVGSSRSGLPLGRARAVLGGAMGRSSRRGRVERVIRLAAEVAKIAAVVANVIREFVKIPW